MASDSGTVDELLKLREKIHENIKTNTPPSPLTIARVVDLSRIALPGDATKSVLDRLLNPESKDAQAAIDVIDAAVPVLKADAVRNLTQPDFSAQLQGHVAVALFENKWLRFSIFGVVGAYAVAAALLLFPVWEAFGNAGEAARLLKEAKAIVGETNGKLAEAKQLVTDVGGRIDVARQELTQVQERLASAKRDIAGLETEFAGKRRDLDVRLAAIESAVASNAADARTRIGAMPQQVDEQVQRAFAASETLAAERLGKIKSSSEGLENQLKLVDRNVAAVDAKAVSTVASLDATLMRIGQREQTATDLFGKLPERIDALFAARDQNATAQIGTKLVELAKKHDDAMTAGVAPLMERLRTRSGEEEGKIARESGVLRGRIEALGDDLKVQDGRLAERTRATLMMIDDMRTNSKTRLDEVSGRLTELERGATTLEQRRREDEARFGSITVFADRSRDLEARLDVTDDRLRALNKSAGPIEELISALSDRATPVAQLVAQAMATTNEEIATQIWVVVRPNREVLVGLLVFAGVATIWLLSLTAIALRRRRPA